MKWFIGLAIIFVLFADTSLSIRITAPGRHFHRRSLGTNQGFIQAHKKFTQTLNHVAATIQEAREGLSETKQTEIHEERSDNFPLKEEVETSEDQPEVVKDAEKEGTCLHPKDVNCKSNEMESVSKMALDQSEVEARILDTKLHESDEEKSNTIIKVEVENDAKTENSTETKLEINIDVETVNSTGVERGNGTEIEAGNSTEIEDGNSTTIEAGNSTEIEAGNSTTVEKGNGTEIEAGNSTMVEKGNGTENHTETLVGQEKVDPSEERSDEIGVNQIIVEDEEEFQNAPIEPKPSNSSRSSFFAKFFKLIKDNSQVILGL